jgi:hypothetical protein
MRAHVSQAGRTPKGSAGATAKAPRTSFSCSFARCEAVAAALLASLAAAARAWASAAAWPSAADRSSCERRADARALFRSQDQLCCTRPRPAGVASPSRSLLPLRAVFAGAPRPVPPRPSSPAPGPPQPWPSPPAPPHLDQVVRRALRLLGGGRGGLQLGVLRLEGLHLGLKLRGREGQGTNARRASGWQIHRRGARPRGRAVAGALRRCAPRHALQVSIYASSASRPRRLAGCPHLVLGPDGGLEVLVVLVVGLGGAGKVAGRWREGGGQVGRCRQGAGKVEGRWGRWSGGRGLRRSVLPGACKSAALGRLARQARAGLSASTCRCTLLALEQTCTRTRAQHTAAPCHAGPPRRCAAGTSASQRRSSPSPPPPRASRPPRPRPRRRPWPRRPGPAAA